MNRGVDRRDVFFSDTDRLEFGGQLAAIHEEFGVETLAYCLMGNHYHLLLRSIDDQLSRAMHQLGTTYTARTNRRRGRDGPLFRGRFHSIPVETDTYLTWSTRYIHRNPLDIAGVQKASNYRWSSYRTYLGRRCPPPFLNTEIVLGMFDHDRDRLAGFTEGERTIDLSTGHAVTNLLQLIDFEIARDDLLHDNESPTSTWQARSVLVLLMDHFEPQPLARAIERHLGIPNPKARAKAVGRARASAIRDPTITRVLAATLAHL